MEVKAKDHVFECGKIAGATKPCVALKTSW